MAVSHNVPAHGVTLLSLQIIHIKSMWKKLRILFGECVFPTGKSIASQNHLPSLFLNLMPQLILLAVYPIIYG